MKLKLDEVLKILLGFFNVLYAGLVIYFMAILGIVSYAHFSQDMAYSVRMGSPLPALIFFAVFAAVYYIRKSKVMFSISLIGILEFLILNLLLK